ncbi:MAG: hypothetical protein ACREQY_08420, partial [Candidatus Binatia bacterium]
LSKLSYSLLIAGMTHFVLVFPEPGPLLRRRPWIAAACYLAVAPFAALTFLLPGGSSKFVVAVEWLNRWVTVVAALALLASVLPALRPSRAEPGDTSVALRRLPRDRARIAVTGLALAVGCYAVGFLGAEFGVLPSAPASVFFAPAWIWLGTLVLASLRDDVFDLGARVREMLARPAAYLLTIFFYVLLLALAGAAFRWRPGLPGWAFPLAFLIVAVALVEPIRRTARALVARTMNAAVLLSARALRDLSVELASSLDQKAIIATVLGMARRLGLPKVRLFLAEGERWAEASDGVSLPKNHPLVEAVGAASSGLWLGDLTAGPSRSDGPPLEVCRDGMRSLGITLAFPLRFRASYFG